MTEYSTEGYAHTRRKPWHKDPAYTEIWGSRDGNRWLLLWIEGRDGRWTVGCDDRR